MLQVMFAGVRCVDTQTTQGAGVPGVVTLEDQLEQTHNTSYTFTHTQ